MKKLSLLATLLLFVAVTLPHSAEAQSLRVGAEGIALNEDETNDNNSEDDSSVTAVPVVSVDDWTLEFGANSNSTLPFIEVGWNILSNVGYDDYTSMTGGDNPGEFLNIREWKSTQVTVSLINLAYYSQKHKIGISTALGIRANNYRFSSGMTLSKNSNASGLVMPSQIEPYNDKGVKKSKFNIASIHIPLELHFGDPQKFAFGVGGYLDMVMNSHTKIKYNGGHKHKVHNYPTNFIQAGATARVSIYGVSLFCAYQPTSIFKSGRGPQTQQWTIGIGL